MKRRWYSLDSLRQSRQQEDRDSASGTYSLFILQINDITCELRAQGLSWTEPMAVSEGRMAWSTLLKQPSYHQRTIGLQHQWKNSNIDMLNTSTIRIYFM